VAKLADALDLGSSVRKDVWVQVPPSAPKKDPLAEGLFYLPIFSILEYRPISSKAFLHQDGAKPPIELVSHLPQMSLFFEAESLVQFYRRLSSAV
jgi:hypothetical protein